MNVFKFSIFIKSKKNSSDIKKDVINCYSQKSKRTKDYEQFVINKWSEIDKEQIKTIYSEKAIVTYNSISNTTYFIAQVIELDSIDQATYEVIVISSLEDISQSLNYVFDDIKEKLTSFKLKIIDNKVLLFIYDGNDIISNKFMIKSNIFSYSEFTTREIIRIIIIMILLLISFLSSLFSVNNTIDNVCYSIIASCIFFIISEALLKISFKKTIQIKDLTKWVEKRDDLTSTSIKLNDDYQKLTNPIV